MHILFTSIWEFYLEYMHDVYLEISNLYPTLENVIYNVIKKYFFF